MNVKKFFVRQEDQSDCGAACLSSIIKYHGGDYPLDGIRQMTGTTRQGTTMLGLYQGAKELGFEAEGYSLDGIDNLKEVATPAILHVLMENRLQHYVVFYGFEKKSLVIGDPGRGIERWDETKLKSVWQSRTVLQLTPGTTFKKTDNEDKAYGNLIHWIKADGNILMAAMFLGFVIAILSLSTAVFSQKLIDVILPARELDKLSIGLVLFGLILLIRTGLGYIRSSFLIMQSRDLNNRMISSFFRSLLRMPKSFFDSKKTGDMVARMNDTRRIQATLSNLAGNLLVEVLVIIVSLAGVFFYSYVTGLLILGFVPVFAVILLKFNKPIMGAQKDVMSSYALNEANYIDVITGIAAVKSTGSIDLFHKGTTMLYNFFQDRVVKLGRIQINFSVATELASAALMMAVISTSSWFVLRNELAIGSLFALLYLSGSIGPSLMRIALFNIQIQEAKVAFKRMEEFTKIKSETDEGETESIPGFQKLTLDGVSFCYPGCTTLIDEINLEIRKGEMRTLLGESGVGKSTILQLIQRFYKATSGKIMVDNRSIDELAMSVLRERIAVVPQDIKIFNSPLLFNIALSDNPAELSAVVAWCKQFHFDKFFEKFPQGYMTLLGEEGANISGGQRQLVGLARALYKDPEMLLIDEGTSAMDRQTEQFVLDLLQKIKESKGVLVVTHRTKVASVSDYIYIVERGRITNHGTPLELLEHTNFYSLGINEIAGLSEQRREKIIEGL
jgi:ATP-binding cassette, subfamily C, bacteriocin exporter